MDITNKVFWNEALKGGTIIGLVSVAFSLMGWLIAKSGVGFWGGFVSLASTLVFVALVYAFTKKISASSPAAYGFSYGRSVGFVIAMMLFAGVLKGLYMTVMNNVVDPEAITRSIDEVMVLMQDFIADEQFDAMYSLMPKMMRNPFYLIFASVINMVVGGLIVGLIVSAFTKRDPDLFADEPVEDEDDSEGNEYNS